MQDAKNNNYCALFYKGMYVEKKNSSYLQQGHCCSSGTGPLTDQIDFLNYPLFVSNRSQWPVQQVKGCDCCWQAERQGQHSFRLGWQQWLDQQDNVDPFTPELLKLDYNVGPICNAKCVHCSDIYSSLWAAEEAKYSKHKIANYGDVAKLDVISSIDLTKLKSLYINGGEPFMSEDPETLLQQVKRQGNISELTFQSNTNGSMKPSDRIIELWLECQAVDIFVSIDATGAQFEYVRYPLTWQTVIDNIKFISSIDKKIRVTFSFALGLHNIDELERTWQWFLDNRDSYNQTMEQFGVHPCYGKLSLTNATQELQQIWQDSLDSEGYWTNYARSLLQRGSAPTNQAWIDYLTELDRRRGLDWTTALPRLRSSLDKTSQVQNV